jgi:hypothetical protein
MTSRLVIISGGQSGVDRAAIDVALVLGLSYGGWCPKGGWAEDCPQPPGLLARYPRLRETPLADPAQRTEWNVRDAEAMLILTDDSGVSMSPGTALAQRLAAGEDKPLLVLRVDQADAAAVGGRWLDGVLSAQPREEQLKLGIGGPRESEAGGIYAKALALLQNMLRGR